MNSKIKNFFAYVGIAIILVILSIVTYYKYFDKINLPEKQDNPNLSQNKSNKDNIRSIKNLNEIKTKNFSITNLNIIFDDENKTVNITGNINNLTNEEKSYKIISYLYNKDKYLIHSKEISIDTKIQAKDTIPFFINHYYEELETDKKNIKNYKLEIK